MKYVNKTFSLPAGPPKITQAQWEKAVGKPTKKRLDKKTK